MSDHCLVYIIRRICFPKPNPKIVMSRWFKEFKQTKFRRYANVGKDRDSFDPLSQNLSGEDSTWMVDRLEIPRIIDCFFIT